jgi:hypothetical protein
MSDLSPQSDPKRTLLGRSTYRDFMSTRPSVQFIARSKRTVRLPPKQRAPSPKQGTQARKNVR